MILTLAQYDMLTAPITNDHFHSRVLRLLSSYNQAIDDASIPPEAQPLPLIPALESKDTDLGPSDTISQLVTFTSSWIDLSSPDPVIAYLSRQVFNLEMAYAAFCGVTTVVIPGPRLSHGPSGVAQFARAVKEALSGGMYLQLHIQIPMDNSRPREAEEDLGDLSRFTRPQYVEPTSARVGPFSFWDAWNTLRSVCKYHNRLSLGKHFANPGSCSSRQHSSP
jgi:protein arginine N-methyltransferase 5